MHPHQRADTMGTSGGQLTFSLVQCAASSLRFDLEEKRREQVLLCRLRVRPYFGMVRRSEFFAVPVKPWAGPEPDMTVGFGCRKRVWVVGTARHWLGGQENIPSLRSARSVEGKERGANISDTTGSVLSQASSIDCIILACSSSPSRGDPCPFRMCLVTSA